VVCVSKAELTGSDDVRKRLERELGQPVLLISSVTGTGLAKLVGEVSRLNAELKAEEAAAAKAAKVTEFSSEKAVRHGDAP
jgi:Fe2+ transport system protein B